MSYSGRVTASYRGHGPGWLISLLAVPVFCSSSPQGTACTRDKDDTMPWWAPASEQSVTCLVVCHCTSPCCSQAPCSNALLNCWSTTMTLNPPVNHEDYTKVMTADSKLWLHGHHLTQRLHTHTSLVRKQPPMLGVCCTLARQACCKRCSPSSPCLPRRISGNAP
jgi:hypothetical protein